jgi:hypothetical protein
MKNTKPILTLTLIALTVFVALWLIAAEAPTPAHCEYATIRWEGRENTHIIRPGGEVEFVSLEFRKVKKPGRADERAFYMNLVMNGLTKEGYEFADMTNDEIVMKRVVTK